MATILRKESVDLYTLLKDTFFPQTTGSIDGENISVWLAKEGVSFEPEELAGALTQLFTDGYVRLGYQAVSGHPITYSIGFARTNKLMEERHPSL